MAEERDYRSYSVAEYDPHQKAMHLKHEEQLSDVLEMDYDFLVTKNARGRD